MENKSEIGKVLQKRSIYSGLVYLEIIFRYNLLGCMLFLFYKLYIEIDMPVPFDSVTAHYVI